MEEPEKGTDKEYRGRFEIFVLGPLSMALGLSVLLTSQIYIFAEMILPRILLIGGAVILAGGGLASLYWYGVKEWGPEEKWEGRGSILLVAGLLFPFFLLPGAVITVWKALGRRRMVPRSRPYAAGLLLLGFVVLGELFLPLLVFSGATAWHKWLLEVFLLLGILGIALSGAGVKS